MTMHFTETAPGVHTTSLVHPKTNRCYNIAVIESSNAWQVFIDGELAARDQPSFKAACARAQKLILNPGSPRMVRTAGILVLLTVTGASAIGIAKLLPASSPTAMAAQTASENLPSPPRPTFQRVRPPQAKPGPAETKTVVRTVLQTTPETAPPAAPQKAPLPIASAKAIASPEMPAQSIRAQETPEKSEATTPQKTRRFSSRNTVFDRKPVANSEKTAPVETVEIVKITPSKISTEPAGPAMPKNPSGSEIAKSPTRTAAAVPEKSPPNEPEARENETNTPETSRPKAQTLPPAPPATAAPLIRSTANTPFQRPKLNALFATINEDDEESVVIRRSQSTPEVAKPEASKRRKTKSSRSKREHATTHKPRNRTRRYHRRRRFAEDRRFYREHRQVQRRRMVCFAHTCRLR